MLDPRLKELTRPRRALRELSRRDRSLLLAVAVAFLLRLVWVIIATRSPTQPLGDAAEYLRMADGFSRGNMPTFDDGDLTASFGPGYSILLTPFALVARATDAVSFAFLASLVNLVAGVGTVVATAFIAARWIGPTARNPAAWIMAIGPAHIYFTSTAHTETVFTCLLLLTLAAVTIVVQRGPSESDRVKPWVLIGLLVGFIMITRTQGAAALVIPALALRRATNGSWRGAVRSTALVLAGALVFLVPWTIRNGVQVGVWSPASTQNAVTVCLGNRDDTAIEYNPADLTRAQFEDCYRNSTYDDPRLGLAPPWWEYGGPDEAKWYRASIKQGVHWAITHPVGEAELMARKQIELWRDEADGVGAGRNYSAENWAGHATRPLHWVANAWLWAVEILALLGLVLVHKCRQALPVWGFGLVFNLTVLVSLALPHYRHAVVPLVVVLASGAVAMLLDKRRLSRPSLPSAAR